MTSIANVIDDAAKIASDLVPPGGQLAEVVGVLVKQVEKLAGGELTHLADEILGIPAAPVEPTVTVTSTPEAPAAVDVAALQASVKQLTDELAAVRSAITPPAGGAA